MAEASSTLMIGVAGGTGSGKTTVARKLIEALPSSEAEIIEFDSYYRDQSHMEKQQRALTNYDHPNALEIALLVEHLAALRGGQAVDVPVYDFVRHTRAKETRHVESAPIIVVEGILTLHEPKVRELLDIKVFVDTDADIRVFRRIRRDIETRGRSFESVREQYYDTVRDAHNAFVEPSKRWADLIVPEGGDNRVAVEILSARLRQSLA